MASDGSATNERTVASGVSGVGYCDGMHMREDSTLLVATNRLRVTPRRVLETCS